MAQQKVIKYTVEHNRKDGVSEEDFIEWFTNTLIPQMVPVMQKNNILKYAVHKTDHQISTAFQSQVDKVRPGWVVSKCDLILEHWVNDLGDIMKLSQDPEWAAALKDQDVWMDNSKSNIHIGYDTIYIEDGTITNVPRK
ncbi:hypothetical protein PFICI_04040 [Pestalotiopsis fici W106-1]|uniref:Dehydratase iacD n=1 Tax=Pestalotiopsis fici (strain W106-1 / CGMCC3.15140) TaxID=1229662 RepID=IACD_PESFW|nr:uncharacterized protein PFICI_04040 [Pestalotiopsis fici W106-1]A0A1J0HSQ1.1 RecName: Full=Dehydratase iacD; AltName: Full=Iso-A82775C biosynthesis cluster protein D [Pestalotiopsis fici W106-1]APC57596.1 EthD [Pestalotiopsis fici]ETS86015.1 hypothetical protein PFICI_04040 [Pestalotiopsis fici W106-1]PSE25327.1 hypothetical protein C7G59_19055 [Acinetobacter baumannii]